MDWFSVRRDVLDENRQQNNIVNKQDNGFPNGLSFSSVAALTLASLFGHLSYNLFEGQIMNYCTRVGPNNSNYSVFE